MGDNSFAPFKKRNTFFIVKNIITNSNKTVRIFHYPIPVGKTRDLLDIEGVGEADIRASLLKGEILHKLLAREITVIRSDIDLLQFNSDQLQFLTENGITIGTQVGSGSFATKQRLDIRLDGACDNVNTIYTIPGGEKFLYDADNKIIVYLNGVKQVLGGDYSISESGGPGTGYDTIIVVVAPDPTDYVTADYYVKKV